MTRYQKLLAVCMPVYGMTLVPHLQELVFTNTTIVLLVAGCTIAMVAHAKIAHGFHKNYSNILAIFFLSIHMALELPHMMSHTHNGIMQTMIGHGLHVAADIAMLIWLCNSIHRALVCFVAIVLLGFTPLLSSSTALAITKPIVLAGILGCVISHTIPAIEYVIQKLKPATS